MPDFNDIKTNLDIELLVVEKVDLDKKWRYDNVISPFARLYFLTEGSCFVGFHDRDFELKKHDLFLVPSFTRSHYRCPDAMQQYFAHFTAKVMGGIDFFSVVPTRYRLSVSDVPFIQEACAQLLRAWKKNNTAGAVTGNGVLRMLLGRFILEEKNGALLGRIQKYNRFRPVLDHLETHIADELSLGDLADVIHLHPTYFSNLFTDYMGLPPLRYLKKRRIERSETLLWQSQAPVAEIAHRVGIADPLYFSRIFKAHTGMTPTEYRKLSRLKI